MTFPLFLKIPIIGLTYFPLYTDRQIANPFHISPFLACPRIVNIQALVLVLISAESPILS